MTIREILAGVPLKSPLPDALAGKRVAGLEYDSRKVEEGFLFFAFPGARTDGRLFADSALQRGALAVVSERPAPGDFRGNWLEVSHGRRALARAVRNFYQSPDSRLSLTGITGTNGKTTTSYLIDSVLRAAGYTTALIGTIGFHVAGETRKAVNTTPESLDLYRLFGELERSGGSAVTMEVSSHALALGRVAGIRFHTAVFTNLTRDHLDFHHTMEEYFAAKQMLFTPPEGDPPKFAVINQDDEYGRRLRIAPETEVSTFGTSPDASVRAVNVQASFEGLRFDLEAAGETRSISSPLLADVNVYNILAACSAALTYKVDMETIVRGIAACRAVPGRFEPVIEGQPFLVVVDYAHTDDALRNAIASARALKPKRVITLFGCGGDRDRAKRPLMGKAAAEFSDFVVLTSDNPRSEDPLDIMNDALVGICRYDTPYLIERDRERAIRLAIEQAEPGDIVLLAGKGHEDYQVLKDRTIHFDDREVAREVLRGIGYKKGGG
jgi:UDP-N-acetylmuramoyl-L-alanyl-D-glutamate--2,6-diaminopimelate ligase